MLRVVSPIAADTNLNAVFLVVVHTIPLENGVSLNSIPSRIEINETPT
jgi:hypothetical protein